jgi:hypothetical protein
MALASKHFLPYPSMERQDLTQGQLGSFKFTPVDSVRKDISREHTRTFQAQQKMIARLHPAQESLDPAWKSHAAFSDTSALSRSATAINTPPDLAFFDNLDNSRLKYGPAAVRSAVQSYSPERIRSPVSECPRPEK